MPIKRRKRTRSRPPYHITKGEPAPKYPIRTPIEEAQDILGKKCFIKHGTYYIDNGPEDGIMPVSIFDVVNEANRVLESEGQPLILLQKK